MAFVPVLFLRGGRYAIARNAATAAAYRKAGWIEQEASLQGDEDALDEVFHELIQDPTSQVRGALGAAFGSLAGPNTWTGTQDFTDATVTGIAGGGGGASALPSYVSTAPGNYDPLRHLYLPSTSAAQRVDAKLAAARAGTGTMHVLACGDSEAAGQNATGGVPNSWPLLLRGWISDGGFPVGGSGLAYPGPTNNTGDPRWTLDPSWTIPGQLFAAASVSGKVATFVSDEPGTSVDIWFFGNGARGATYTIDGGSPATYTPSGASVAEKVTVTGLADAVHTVAITSGSAAGSVYLIGVNCYRTSGIQVHNAGISGSSTTTWLSGSSSFSGWYGLSHLYTPDLVVMSFGVNEALNEGLSVSTYKSQFETLAAKYQALGANIMMLVEPQPQGVPLATWQGFAAAQYEISETLGARMVDILDRWGDYTTASANGLMSDTIHPNATGYSDEAYAVRQLILP